MPTLRTLPPRNLGTIPGTPAYTFTHTNPLDPGIETEIAPHTALVAWAGWLDASAEPVLGLFPSDHRLWTQGLRALRESLTYLDPILRDHGADLYLRPACDLVLSDPHSIAALLKDPPSDRLRILVDPIAMLTATMAPNADDHIPRMLDKLGHFEACAAIVLAGATPTQDDRLTHLPLDPSRTIDSALLRAWRQSAFADREVFVPTEACRQPIEQATNA